MKTHLGTLALPLILALCIETPAVTQDRLPTTAVPPEPPVVQTTPGGGWVTVTSATPLHEAREADDDLKARRARIGFWTTCGATTAGFVMLTVGAFAYSGYCPEGDCIADRYAPVVANASALFLTGAVGMLTSGIIMARRKRQRGRDQHRVAAGGRRRVRWDLEKSSAVF